MRKITKIRSVLAALENEETGPNAAEAAVAHRRGAIYALRWVLS